MFNNFHKVALWNYSRFSVSSKGLCFQIATLLFAILTLVIASTAHNDGFGNDGKYRYWLPSITYNILPRPEDTGEVVYQFQYLTNQSHLISIPEPLYRGDGWHKNLINQPVKSKTVSPLAQIIWEAAIDLYLRPDCLLMPFIPSNQVEKRSILTLHSSFWNRWGCTLYLPVFPIRIKRSEVLSDGETILRIMSQILLLMQELCLCKKECLLHGKLSRICDLCFICPVRQFKLYPSWRITRPKFFFRWIGSLPTKHDEIKWYHHY